jgi:hypothetical protein
LQIANYLISAYIMLFPSSTRTFFVYCDSPTLAALLPQEKKKKTAEQLASEAAAAAEQSAQQAAADSEKLRAVQAAELASCSSC